VLIETPEEINRADLIGLERVGVTAGASTPDWMIQRVVERLREIDKERKAGRKRKARGRGVVPAQDRSAELTPA